MENITMSIIKAQRTTVKFCEGVEVDGYMLPDGEFRVGKLGVALAVGYGKNWVGQLKGKSLKALQDMGFSGEITTIELDPIKGGGTHAQTISKKDFYILIAYAASRGKRNAMRILAKSDKIEQVKKLENKKRPIPNRQTEKGVQKALAEGMEGAVTEVSTPAGKIDILTSTELIEVKEWSRWKEAIGQVLCYGDYYPSHFKRIHFFGIAHSDFIALVKKHCDSHNISVSWEIRD